MSLQSYKDLIVWQKSMLLVKQVYLLTANLPSFEKFGLSSQMQRAAVAIPSNIAEGYGRQYSKEYVQFISIAQGSACELETQLLICKEVNSSTIVIVDECLSLLNEVQKMLRVLSKSMLANTTQSKP